MKSSKQNMKSKKQKALLETVRALLKQRGLEAKTPGGRSRIERVRLYTGYVEPGYSNPKSGIIAAGDWNNISWWDDSAGKSEDLDDAPGRLSDELAALGVEIEWDDEWCGCDNCDKMIRINADSYGWQRSYVEDGTDRICLECVKPKQALESFEGKHTQCWTISSIDPADHGYIQINDESFEHGLYSGQDAAPHKIVAILEKVGVTRYLFTLNSCGQFDSAFSVWLHKKQKAKLKAARAALQDGETDGPSVSGGMQQALKSADAGSAALRKEQQEKGGVIVSKLHVDGTADTKLVSPADFFEGKALD